MPGRASNFDALWKVIAIGCIGAMIGAGGDWLFRGRDTLTHADLAAVKAQLGDHTEQLREIKASLLNVQVNTAKIAEHDGVTIDPPPPPADPAPSTN